MTTISLKERLGEALVGRIPAMRLRDEVEESARSGEEVALDFEGVVLMSPSFADEMFAKLDPTLLAAGSIRLENVDDQLHSFISIVRHARSSAS